MPLMAFKSRGHYDDSTPSPSLPSARHSRTSCHAITTNGARTSVLSCYHDRLDDLCAESYFTPFSNHNNVSFHKQETMTASLAASQAMAAAAATTTAASASSSENTATNPQQQQQQQKQRAHRKLLLPFRRRGGGGVVDITNTSASLAQTQCNHGELQIVPTMSAESKSSQESTTVACNRGTGRRRFHGNSSRLDKERTTCSLLFALLPEFVPKFILEVLGGAGAIWGFSEACGLRRPSTIWFWRPAALCVGFLFLLKFLHQFYCKIQQLQRQQAPPVSYYRDLELGESTSSSPLPLPPPVDTTILELTRTGAPSTTTTTTTTGSIDSFQEPPPTLSSTSMMILEERPLSPPTTEWTSLTGAAAAQQAAATLSPLDPLPHRRTLTR